MTPRQDCDPQQSLVPIANFPEPTPSKANADPASLASLRSPYSALSGRSSCLVSPFLGSSGRSIWCDSQSANTPRLFSSLPCFRSLLLLLLRGRIILFLPVANTNIRALQAHPYTCCLPGPRRAVNKPSATFQGLKASQYGFIRSPLVGSPGKIPTLAHDWSQNFQVAIHCILQQKLTVPSSHRMAMAPSKLKCKKSKQHQLLLSSPPSSRSWSTPWSSSSSSVSSESGSLATTARGQC